MTQPPRFSKKQDEITENLKRAFEKVEKEALPDRFAQLLDQLKAQDRPDDTRSEPDE